MFQYPKTGRLLNECGSPFLLSCMGMTSSCEVAQLVLLANEMSSQRCHPMALTLSLTSLVSSTDHLRIFALLPVHLIPIQTRLLLLNRASA